MNGLRTTSNPSIFLMEDNPRKRRSRKKKSSRRRSRKGVMPAGLKRYWAGKRSRKVKVSRRPRKRRKTTVVTSFSTNSRRSKMAKHRKHRKSRRRFHRNPPAFLSGGGKGFMGKIMTTGKRALYGAGAMLASDAIANAINSAIGGKPDTKRLIRAAVPIAAAIFVPKTAPYAEFALAGVLRDEIRKVVPASMQSYLGEGEQYNFPTIPYQSEFVETPVPMLGDGTLPSPTVLFGV